MYPVELDILLHRALESRLESLRELTAGEDWLDDPDSIHDVRVASRRIRAVLDLADPGLYPGFEKQRRRCRRLTTLLGSTRELDVHVARLESLGPELGQDSCHAVLEHLLEGLDRRRRKARRKIREAFPELRIPELAHLLEISPTPRPPGTQDLQSAVRAILEPRLHAALLPVGKELETEDPAALHRLRILVKKLRYSLEILGAALPNPPETWLPRLKAFQTALGDHHDWTTLESELWTQHAFLTGRGRPALAAGVLDILGGVVEQRRGSLEAVRLAAQQLSFAEARAEILGETIREAGP